MNSPEKMERLNAYIADYEFRGDTAYRPTDNERALIEDALHGWLAEEEDLAAARQIAALTQPNGAGARIEGGGE